MINSDLGISSNRLIKNNIRKNNEIDIVTDLVIADKSFNEAYPHKFLYNLKVKNIRAEIKENIIVLNSKLSFTKENCPNLK
jgi:hypothetical protein